MRINKDTRNAVSALVCLHEYTQQANLPMTLKKLAKESSISLHALVQLFHKLKLAGVVHSVRGPGGGYLLRAGKENITLAQLVHIIEGDIMVHTCRGKKNCTQGKQCAMHNFWSHVGHLLEQSLDIPVLHGQSILEKQVLKPLSHA